MKKNILSQGCLTLIEIIFGGIYKNELYFCHNVKYHELSVVTRGLNPIHF